MNAKCRGPFKWQTVADDHKKWRPSRFLWKRFCDFTEGNQKALEEFFGMSKDEVEARESSKVKPSEIRRWKEESTKKRKKSH